MVLASLCLAANEAGVRWMMDALVSTAFVAHLAILLMPVLLISQVVRAMTITAMPATSAYQATGNHAMLRELLIRGIRYTMVLAMAVPMVAVFLMKDVLTAWVGADYAFLTPYALVLVVSSSFMMSSSIGHHMLKGLGELRTVVWIYFGALVVLPFGLILALFGLGCDPYWTVTAGLATGHVACGLANALYAARAVGARFLNLAMRGWVACPATAAGAGLTVWSAGRVMGGEGLLFHAGLAGLAVAGHLAGCYFVIATKAERQQALGMLKRAGQIVSGRCIRAGKESEDQR